MKPFLMMKQTAILLKTVESLKYSQETAMNLQSTLKLKQNKILI